jgi:DCN1-like protein 1/2
MLLVRLLCLQKGQKCVQLDTATGMWQLLLGQVRPWPLLDAWLTYLSKHHNRAISKDTWSQLYDFIKVCAAVSLRCVVSLRAWPPVLDWAGRERGENGV